MAAIGSTPIAVSWLKTKQSAPSRHAVEISYSSFLSALFFRTIDSNTYDITKNGLAASLAWDIAHF